MTKIFEALEQAQKDRAQTTGGPPGANDGGSAFSMPAARADKILVELYESISKLLRDRAGNVVEFIGTSRSAGASVLLCRFAKVVSDTLDKMVLYVNVNQPVPGKGVFAMSGINGGLAKVVKGECHAEDVIQQVEDSRLYVTGLSSMSSEDVTGVIYSPRFKELLEELGSKFDLIVLDPPHANGAPECLALTSRADVVILVVESERTRWQVAQALKERIEMKGGKVSGVVLNKRRHHIPPVVYKRL